MADSRSIASSRHSRLASLNVKYPVEVDDGNTFNTKKVDIWDNASYNPSLNRKSHKSTSSYADVMNKMIPLVDKSSKVNVKTSDVHRWCALTLAPWKDEDGMTQWCGVQGAHLISQSTGPEENRNIERAWGLNIGDLNLDCPQNIIPLRADWHASFDGHDLCILPHNDIMRKIFLRLDEHVGNPKEAGKAVPWLNSKGDLNLALHRYKFIPVGKRSKTVPLIRRRFEPGKEYKELVPNVCDFFRPPNFDDYPEIHSLAHPYAVIWKAVKDFGNMNEEDFVSDRHWGMMQMASNIVQRWNTIIKKDNLAKARARSPPPQPDAEGDSNDHPGSPGPSPSTDGSSTSPSAGGSPGAGYSTGAPSGYRRPAGIPSEVSYTNNQPSLCFSSSRSQSAEAELVSEEDQSDEESEDEDDRPAALAPYEPQDIDKWAVDSRSVDVGGLDDSFIDLLSPSVKPTSAPTDYDEEPAEVPDGDWEDWQPDFAKRLGEHRFSALGVSRDEY